MKRINKLTDEGLKTLNDITEKLVFAEMYKDKYVNMHLDYIEQHPIEENKYTFYFKNYNDLICLSVKKEVLKEALKGLKFD